MSEENVELAHRTVDALNRPDLDAILALADDDIEGTPALASIEGRYHGHAGIRRWWESLFSSLPDFTVEVVEVRDPGDLTVAVVDFRAEGAVSQASVEQRVWQVAKWRDGKAIWWQTFRTEADALEAAAAVGILLWTKSSTAALHGKRWFSRDSVRFMSEENVDIVRRGFDAYSRGDGEAWLAGFSDKVKLYPRPEEPGVRDCYEGIAGLQEYLANWFSGWEQYTVEPEQYIDAGGT
jgi:ketosteroid isomerase-like protein